MFNQIKSYYKLYRFRRLWRQANKHNETYPINDFISSCVSVGNYSYGGLNVLTHNDKSRLQIGNFCSIAPNVTFILSSDHNMKTLSTYPFRVKFRGDQYEAVSKGDITVGDDVWIGYGATILSGVSIGQGAVIASGAVVTKDVPSYAVVAGVPANVLEYRFSSDVINKLLTFDFNKLTKEYAMEHIDDFYRPIEKLADIDWIETR